jgi:hypothetical protein
MDAELLKADPLLLPVDETDILHLLERSENQTDQHTTDLVKFYLSKCRAIAAPQGGYLWQNNISFKSSSKLEIDGNSFSVGKIIAGKLKHVVAVALFAATAGPGPESLARELMGRGLYLEGYIVDLIGTAMVESMADQIHRKIAENAATLEMKVTNRYSPGYCSWKVDEQQKLFLLMPAEPCGIALTETSLMTPIKSVSGIIGIGPGVTFSEDICEVCPMKNCTFRKT